MKKILLMAALALMALTMQAKVDVEVSETVELMSILARTAGWDPYHMDMGGQYIEDVEAWFAPYENHPTISYFDDFMNQYAQGFHEPMYLATALTTDGQQVKMLCPKQYLRENWNAADMDEFVAQLNKFYTDTRFHEFYQQHQDFYNGVLQDYRANVMQYFNQDWYAPFYGTNPEEVFRVIIGFTNGGQNYGVAHQFPGQPKENISICGYWLYPNDGYVYDLKHGRDAAPTLVHEFNHSFVNYLQDIEKNAALLGDIPQRLLEKEFMRMTQYQSYGEGSIVLNESIVRAAVILYMMENGFSPEELREELESNISRGFTWLPELVTAMRHYNTHRNKYPTLNDFYPQIAKVLKNYLDADDKKMDKVLNFKQSSNQPSAASSHLKAEVMETVELMSILSRLAGNREYNSIKPNPYIQDVDAWFEPFKQHPIIEYYQGVRQQCHILYDAPINLAVRLSTDGGKVVKLQEEAGDCGLDQRWNYVDMNKFLELLNQFYTDTHFHEFFQNHQAFYQSKLDAFNVKLMPFAHPEWFSNLYGKPSVSEKKVIMGFATRDGNSYGATRHLKGQPWDEFCVAGYYDFDNEQQIPEEMVNWIAGSITTMLNHDFNQSSTTAEKNAALLDETGTRLLDNNQWLKRAYGYSDGKTVMNRSLKKAIEILYLMENGVSADYVNHLLTNGMSSGFVWMPELVNALRDYSSHRNKYPTINDYYPQIAKVLNKYLDDEQKRLDKALK